jgi:hypothetical protein
MGKSRKKSSITPANQEPENGMDQVSKSFAVGNALLKVRLARGYSLEDLSITTGLTTMEITAAERGDDVPAHNVKRIEHALK